MAAYLPVYNQSYNFSQNNQLNPQFSRSLDNSYVRNYHSNSNNSPQPHKRDQQLIENLNLNDHPSFARNFKNRLFNVDPKEQQAKFRVQDKYRQQLKMQIQEDRRRKQAKKLKQQAQDEKLQRNFYQNMKIQAQKKANQKQEPNFFLMRTNKGKFSKENLTDSRKKKREVKLNNYLTDQSLQKSNQKQLQSKQKLKRTFYQPPQIIKRGGYHNKSSLDQLRTNPQKSAQNNQNPQNQQNKFHSLHKKQVNDLFQSQNQAQQNRIKQLLLFQDSMLRKLDYFKRQILTTSKVLQLDKQLQKVKIKLRSKPLNMNKINNLNTKDGIENVFENDSFYHLPMINKNQKVYQGDRQMKKKKDKERNKDKGKQQQINEMTEHKEKQIVQLQDQKMQEQNENSINIQKNINNAYNDKNIAAQYNLTENIPQNDNQ